MADFFISHSGDLATAKLFKCWVEEAGCRAEMIVPGEGCGTSFVANMNDSLSQRERLLASFTASYLASPPCRAEMDAMFIGDIDGK